MERLNELQAEAVALLERLVATPSVSRDEARTADLLTGHLAAHGIAAERLYNNVYARAAHFDAAKPTLLLNSHHDTVRPNSGYTRDPYDPAIEGDRLYGLGSNDAGASVVSLLAAFRHFYDREEMKYNLCVARKRTAAATGWNACCPSWVRSTSPSSASPRKCSWPSPNGD